MMIYKLIDRVTDLTEIDRMLEDKSFPINSDYALIVEDEYFIQRRTTEKMMYYVHFKYGRVVKICCYEKIR